MIVMKKTTKTAKGKLPAHVYFKTSLFKSDY